MKVTSTGWHHCQTCLCSSLARVPSVNFALGVASYLMPQALQSGVPSSASLHMGVFFVQQDAHSLLSGRGVRQLVQVSSCNFLFSSPRRAIHWQLTQARHTAQKHTGSVVTCQKPQINIHQSTQGNTTFFYTSCK